jgi:hypothetical protein
MEPVIIGNVPMKEDVKTATDGGNRKHADGEEVNGNSIVIKVDREIDRC